MFCSLGIGVISVSLDRSHADGVSLCTDKWVRDTGASQKVRARDPRQLRRPHPRHVDIRQDQDERSVACIGNALKGQKGRLRKLHREAVGAYLKAMLT